MRVPWKIVLRWAATGGVVLLLLGMVFLRPVNGGASAFVRPLLQFSRTLGQGFGGALEGLFAGRELRAEVRNLEAQVAALELELAQENQARLENVELRAILDLPDPPAWRRVVAPIIGRDPAGWIRGFRIGRGTRDGLTLGAVALERTNVLGRVVQVHRTTAYVATVADPACRMSVRIRGTDAVGLLGGVHRIASGGLPQCRVTYLPRDTEYRLGQVVQTTGLGESIPGGLTVGRLVPWSGDAVADIRDNSYARVAVAPLADFGRIRFVTLLCPPAP